MAKTSTATATRSAATPGFAIEITETTDLGMGMLIAEFDAGRYEPVTSVTTIAEAREVIDHDMLQRMRALNALNLKVRRERSRNGHEANYPSLYVVWARGIDGAFRKAAEILA